MGKKIYILPLTRSNVEGLLEDMRNNNISVARLQMSKTKGGFVFLGVE